MNRRRGFHLRPATDARGNEIDHAEIRANERSGNTDYGADWEPTMTEHDDSSIERLAELQVAVNERRGRWAS